MFVKLGLCYFALYLVCELSTAYENNTENDTDIGYFHARMENIGSINEEDDADDGIVTYPAASESRKAKATEEVRKCCTCEKSFVIGRQLVKHSVAATLCNRIGMDLAAIMSHKEEHALIRAWKEAGLGVGISATHERTLWLGGVRCSSCASEFVWDSTGKPVVYTDYLKGQPNNVNNAQNCLTLEYGGRSFNASDPKNSFGWNDLECDTKKKFACQSRCCSS